MALASNSPTSKSTEPNLIYRQQVNTNLTEISDWLTKIIVGLGLINLKQIPSLTKRAASLLASNTQGSSGQGQLAYAIFPSIGP